KHYTSIFKNSKILSTSHYGDAGPGQKEQVIMITFQLEGQEFMTLNGRPHFKFSEAISLYVNCETQKEIDELTAKLNAGSESNIQYGWLKDKFGLSWQIAPSFMAKLTDNKDPARRDRVMTALMKMKKLDIAALKKAYDAKA